MPRVSKEKQKETLNKMKNRRYEDMVFLREEAKKKLDWAITEKQRGLEQIENLKIQVTRLDGYIIAMKEIYNKKKESPNADHTN